MTGAPRAAYASRDFVIVHKASVRALGSWSEAGVFQRVAYRCERDGFWRATMQEIAEEVCLSERQTKRILDRLREKGWLASEREKHFDATLTWSVVWADEPAGQDESANLSSSATPDKTAGQTESANLSLSRTPDEALSESANMASSESANMALSSYKTDETRETKNTPAVAGGRRDLNEGRDDVNRLCQHLSERLTGHEVKHTITKAWLDAARLMLDTDGRDEDKVHIAIDWCQDSEFWRANIHSMPTLREKYDVLRLQAQRQRSGKGKGNAYLEPTEQVRADMAAAFNG